MTTENLTKAKQEAERFLIKLAELEREQRIAKQKGWHKPWFPKQSGSVRRASMDLTRALAELRKY